MCVQHHVLSLGTVVCALGMVCGVCVCVCVCVCICVYVRVYAIAIVILTIVFLTR